MKMIRAKFSLQDMLRYMTNEPGRFTKIIIRYKLFSISLLIKKPKALAIRIRIAPHPIMSDEELSLYYCFKEEMMKKVTLCYYRIAL